eukprot:scaffold2765_cov328-Prasinococcus_capsulatus_cf.AAC.8
MVRIAGARGARRWEVQRGGERRHAPRTRLAARPFPLPWSRPALAELRIAAAMRREGLRRAAHLAPRALRAAGWGTSAGGSSCSDWSFSGPVRKLWAAGILGLAPAAACQHSLPTSRRLSLAVFAARTGSAGYAATLGTPLTTSALHTAWTSGRVAESEHVGRGLRHVRRRLLHSTATVPGKMKVPVPPGMKRYKPVTPGMRHRLILDRAGLWKGAPYKPLTVGLRKKGGRNHYGRITVRHRGGGAKRRYRFVDFKRSDADAKGKVLRLEYDPNRSARIALVDFTPGSVDTEREEREARAAELGLTRVQTSMSDADERRAKMKLSETVVVPVDRSRDIRYVLAPDGLQLGDTVGCSRTDTHASRPIISAAPTDCFARCGWVFVGVGQICSGASAELATGHTMALEQMPLNTMVHNVELAPGGGGKIARAAGVYATLIAKGPK